METRYEIEGFETTDSMRADLAHVFGGEYNIPVDFKAPRVLDIGACHGAFALWAQARWPGAEVTCYEPAVEALSYLCNNTDGHDIEIVPVALSASGRGMMELHHGKVCEGANSLYTDVVPVINESEHVSVMHPKNLPPCDILKMDCEGAEWEIVENYQHYATCKAVLLEYHTQENYEKCDKFLTDRGLLRTVLKSYRYGLGVACYVKADELAKFYEQYKHRVLIVSPIYKGDGHPQFVNAVKTTLNELTEQGIYASYDSVQGDAHIERARAGLLGRFLAEPYWTHILMVDSDLEWHPSVVTALVERDLPCVGAAYTFKEDTGPLANQPVLRSWGKTTTENHGGVVPVRWLGGGFIMCRRDLIERMCAASPELRFDTNPGHGIGSQMETYALWNPIIVDQPEWGDGKQEMLSEDYSFCERINRLGETCWLDIYAQLAHWDGEKAYILKDRSEAA